MINLKIVGAAALLAMAPVLVVSTVDARPGGGRGGVAALADSMEAAVAAASGRWAEAVSEAAWLGEASVVAWLREASAAA